MNNQDNSDIQLEVSDQRLITDTVDELLHGLIGRVEVTIAVRGSSRIDGPKRLTVQWDEEGRSILLLVDASRLNRDRAETEEILATGGSGGDED